MTESHNAPDVKGAIFSDEQQTGDRRTFPQLRCATCGQVIGFRFVGKGQRWPQCCGHPMVRVEKPR